MIKVTVGEQKTQSEKPFPKLMIVSEKNIADTGTIVIVKSKDFSSVTVIHSPDNYWPIGHAYTPISMDYFTDYNEPITLQNA
jgi:hypothetical protein